MSDEARLRRRAKLQLAVGWLLFSLALALCCGRYHQRACFYKAEAMELPAQWDLYTGCLVETRAGWMSIENVITVAPERPCER